MAKTLKNKDETMTIRVNKATKERAKAIYQKIGTNATLASFLGDMVLFGLQVEENLYERRSLAIQEVTEFNEGVEKPAKSKRAG